MNITKLLLTSLISSVVLISIAIPAYAEEGNIGKVIYANGGIGQEESEEMRAKAGDFNLHLYMSEGTVGYAVTGVQIAITDNKGNAILDVPSSGPMLFAHVVNGTYKINATYKGTTVIRKVVVTNHRSANIYLIWKATEMNLDNELEDTPPQ